MKLFHYLKLAFMGTLFFDKSIADTCLRVEDFKHGCYEYGCFYFEGDSIPTSEIAIASKPVNFTGAQFVKDNLMGNTQEYGTIGCNFKAKSGAEFTFFYDKDNATISSSNWKQNQAKNDRFDCKSESNDVNNCPFRFIKNN